VGKLNEHRVRVRAQLQIGVSRLEKGMIIKARYNPIVNSSRGTAQEYMMLILNPGFQKKVHALSLDNFTHVRLNQLAEDVGLIYIPSFQKKRKLDIPKLEMNVSSKRFYASNLKKDMNSKWGNSYRTFDTKHFNKLFLCDYKFSNTIEEKFLLTEKKKEEIKKQNEEAKDKGISS